MRIGETQMNSLDSSITNRRSLLEKGINKCLLLNIKEENFILYRPDVLENLLRFFCGTNFQYFSQLQ